MSELLYYGTGRARFNNWCWYQSHRVLPDPVAPGIFPLLPLQHAASQEPGLCNAFLKIPARSSHSFKSSPETTAALPPPPHNLTSSVVLNASSSSYPSRLCRFSMPSFDSLKDEEQDVDSGRSVGGASAANTNAKPEMTHKPDVYFHTRSFLMRSCELLDGLGDRVVAALLHI